jgi:hypothetical protein
MSEVSIDRGQAPVGLLLGLSAVAVTGVSVIAWLLIVLSTIFSWYLDWEWIYTGLALPAAGVGALVAQLTRRRAYFWVGLAITLVPLVAYVLLAATAPPPPPGWND